MILLETNNRVVEESISVRIKNALTGYVSLIRKLVYGVTAFDSLFTRRSDDRFAFQEQTREHKHIHIGLCGSVVPHFKPRGPKEHATGEYQNVGYQKSTSVQ